MRHPLLKLAPSLLVVAAGLIAIDTAAADEDFERAPIEYSKSQPENPVAALQAELDAGAVKLAYDKNLGYLRAVLEKLDIPIESQMLVFSKTSLQRSRIAARTPRAIYFNDDTYVGFCRAGEVMEISTADPKLGAVFYSLDQHEADAPKLVRQTDNCLVCHSSSRTEGVPGHLVRSVFARASGEPILSAGSYSVDHTTPLAHRWGGWYVTGLHGAQTHMGNLVVRGREPPDPSENADGLNVTRLDDRFPVEGYLAPYSDIVALMVLEHQVLVHNRLTSANFSAQAAMHYQAELNRALGQPEDAPLESTTRRIQVAGDDLVEAILLADEAKLTDEISGVSGFAEAFSQRGPRDSQGRSLRELDLKHRLFKYPCSYLIYSPAFDSLPDAMRSYVWTRLWDVLSGKDQSPEFAHLSAADRQAITEIIRETKKDLPAPWQ
jgi:hypothetical protein